MGAVAYTSGSGSFSVPSVVQRVWVSCVGGGGGGRNGGAGGGGGGWGYGAVNISSTNIGYSVGSGGAVNSNGSSSFCSGIIGGGGATGGGGGGFSAPNGANGSAGISSNNKGGAAGGVSGGGTTSEFFAESGPDSSETCSNYFSAGGGGNGNNGFGGTNGGGNGNISLTIECGEGEFGSCQYQFYVYTITSGNGGAYGGGGGSAVGGAGCTYSFASVRPGVGSNGIVYVSWIDLSASKTTVRSNEPVTVSWNSPIDVGSTTVSFVNTGSTANTQTYTRTDSRGAQSTISFTVLPEVRIDSFTANPNPQTSGSDGIPNFDTALNWSLNGQVPLTYTLTSGTFSSSGSTGLNSGVTVTNLPQSEAGTTSPATRSYTLSVTDGFSTDTEVLTVSVTNDNTPNDYSIPNQNNLEPDTFYVINLGAITGIDMITNVIGGPGVAVSKNNLQNYVSSVNIVNNDSVQLRFRSDPFNQDPSGQPTAPRTLYVDIGPVRRFFTISTRAPDVNETFNLPNENNKVPYPDIDTISELSEPYIVSNTLLVDDIELQDPSGVEIKTSNSNTQIRKRIAGTLDWGPWQDVRSI